MAEKYIVYLHHFQCTVLVLHIMYADTICIFNCREHPKQNSESRTISYFCTNKQKDGNFKE